MMSNTAERVLTAPLAPAGYRSLARELERTPHVTLRVSGFDGTLAALEFLEWFPRLRRLSIAHLHYVKDLSPLNLLPDDLEYLDLGETQGPLDLAPATRFSNLSELRVAGHRRHLAELVEANKNLRGLSLWRIPADVLLPKLPMQRLESLAVTLGSVKDPRWLTQFPTLRYLALRGTRGISDVGMLRELKALEWLWLDALSSVGMLPDFTCNVALVRAELTEMRGLREVHALQGLAQAPRLRELVVTESHLPVEAFHPFVRHPTLEGVGVGLGSARRNREAEAVLSRLRQRSPHDFAAEQGLLFMT